MNSITTVSADPGKSPSTEVPTQRLPVPNLRLHRVTHFDVSDFNTNATGRASLPLSPSSDEENAPQKAEQMRPLERLLLATEQIFQQPHRERPCNIAAPPSQENSLSKAAIAHIERHRKARLHANQGSHIDIQLRTQGQSVDRNALKAALSSLIPGITQEVRALPRERIISLLVPGLLALLNVYARCATRVAPEARASDLLYLMKFKEHCPGTPLCASIQTAIDIIEKLHKA